MSKKPTATSQLTLFDAEPSEAEPLFIAQTDDDGSEWGDFDSCLIAFGTNRCTLDGAPARIIGTPRTTEYAMIEPVDFEHDPIRCCWDVVDLVMQADGSFVRADDDTDD
jgi:hypothetical protein